MAQDFIELIHREKIKGFVHFWAGPQLNIAAIDPESAKFALKSPGIAKYNFISSPTYFSKALGSHVVNANGEDWKRHRNFVSSGFTTKALQDYFPIFLTMTEKVLSRISEQYQNGDVDCNSWSAKFTLDLLGNTIFHYDFKLLEEKSSSSYGAYKTLIQHSNTFYGLILILFPWMEIFPLPQLSKLVNATDQLKTLFIQIIKERQNSQHYGDVLDNLLKSQHEGEYGLSEVELISNLYIFFVAGHETTANALVWECISLARHQDIQDKIYHEIETTIGNAIPTLEDLSKLTYLDCFISEVLRLYTPVPYLPTRVTIEDVKFGDKFIPKGTVVGLFIEAIHKDPNHWPDPEKFDPDRFLPENKKGRHHYAYLPFSLGPRQCLGNNFSLTEQRLFLTRLLQKFRVLPPKNSTLKSKQATFGFMDCAPIRLEVR